MGPLSGISYCIEIKNNIERNSKFAVSDRRDWILNCSQIWEQFYVKTMQRIISLDLLTGWLIYTVFGHFKYNAVNSLRPRRNGRYNADDIFNCIFLKENVWIPTKISLKFVPKGPINNIPALVQIMAWRRPGDKPLSEPMLIFAPTHICVTRPQWVKLQWWLTLV